jgi:hypothetical protein
MQHAQTPIIQRAVFIWVAAFITAASRVDASVANHSTPGNQNDSGAILGAGMRQFLTFVIKLSSNRRILGANQAISPLKIGLAARTGVEPVYQP